MVVAPGDNTGVERASQRLARRLAGRPAAGPAPWGPTANREEARSYVQRRLALFSKLMFWIFWILVGFVLALYEVYPATRPAQADLVHMCAVGGLFILAVIWFVALKRHSVSITALYRIDAFYAIVIGLVFGMSAYFCSDLRAAMYSAFVWHTFMIFSRVIVLPSSGRRTVIVTTCSFVPLVVAGIAVSINYPARLELPPPAFMVGLVIFIAVAVVLAGTGSQVIYGLRRQVVAAIQLGQYTLDEKIGEGGMGVVYRARHAMLRRPTAIKLLPPGKAGAQAIRRFEREVQHMSQLTHPNTVAIFDYGRSLDGVFYYAMEYLDGIDLESLVRREGPQPANVLLCQRGRKPDVVKVLDFGLVQEITRDADDSSSRAIIGTPAYLAPEAVTDPDRVGPASDLYAVGAVGYYLLTGCRVFEGRTAIDVCVQHATATPVPPSRRTDNPIPAELEALILTCLAKDPAARPASAEALRGALTALLAAGAWDEAAARAWWQDFEARGGSGRRPANPQSPGDLGAAITVDIHGRADGSTRQVA